MSDNMTVARPYAKAAFDFAVENKALDHWQSMLAFSAQVAQDATMKQVLVGSMATQQLAELFIGVCGEQIDTSGQNFMKVLAENNRLAALPSVYLLFNEYKAELDKEIDVDIVSASALSDEQKTNVSAALEKRFARKVKLNCSVDPKLVAGMVIKAGDTVIDGSVNSKLNRLSDALQA